MPKKTKPAQQAKRAARSEGVGVDRLAEMVRREVQAKLGANATFEQRRDAAAELMREVLQRESDNSLGESEVDK